MKKNNRIIVIFVEGETEAVFYKALIDYYRQVSTTPIESIKIVNVRGIGRFESNVSAKLKTDFLSVYKPENITVFCAFDTDVFEFAKKPPTNWSIVEKKVKSLGIDKFHLIKARSMIEDWFLKDLNGICKYLKIKAPKKVEGTSGLQKIKKLYDLGGKIYLKGSEKNLISNLDFLKIRNSIDNELQDLEINLKFTMPAPAKVNRTVKKKKK